MLNFTSDVVLLYSFEFKSKIFVYMQFSRYRKLCFHNRGDEGIRTPDPLLARQVLSQLSYAPKKSGSHLLSHIVSNIVPSAA